MRNCCIIITSGAYICQIKSLKGMDLYFFQILAHLRDWWWQRRRRYFVKNFTQASTSLKSYRSTCLVKTLEILTGRKREDQKNKNKIIHTAPNQDFKIHQKKNPLNRTIPRDFTGTQILFNLRTNEKNNFGTTTNVKHCALKMLHIRFLIGYERMCHST